jgi:hypothetical protein
MLAVLTRATVPEAAHVHLQTLAATLHELRCCLSFVLMHTCMQLDGSQMDGQPLATPDDCLQAEAIAREDPQV